MYKLIVLDRDGVLNEKPENNKYVFKVNQLVIKNDILKKVIQLQQKKIQFCVATNQKGVGLGLIPLSELYLINNQINLVLQKLGGKKLRFYICPHIDDVCNCRKPKPGLLFKAMKDFKVNRDETLFVGDQITDQEAAINAGINFIYVSQFVEFQDECINVNTKNPTKWKFDEKIS